MKEVNINISIAIHSKSIALFRHCLGLILVLNGLSYLIFENVRIISKHRIMAPRKSRIWPLNLFDLGGEFWAYFLILWYIYFGFKLCLSGRRSSNSLLLVSSIFLYLCQSSILPYDSGKILLSFLLFLNIFLPSSSNNNKMVEENGKWYQNATTFLIYTFTIFMYYLSGWYKIYDLTWTKSNTLQVSLLGIYGGSFGMYLGKNFPMLCIALQRSTFIVEMIVPFFLLIPETKLIASLALFSFHVGICIAMQIGIFPYINLCLLTLFFPPSVSKKITFLLANIVSKKNNTNNYNANSILKEVKSSSKKYYYESKDHVDHDNNTEMTQESFRFKQMKKKRRSKTPLRKKSTSITNQKNDETGQLQQLQSPQPIVTETTQAGVKCFHNKSGLKRWLNIMIPLLYTLFFLLCSYDKFVEHVFYKNKHDSAYRRSLTKIQQYLDIPIFWMVFTSGQQQNKSPLVLTQRTSWGSLIGKVCATDLKIASSLSDDGTSNIKCDWVNLHGATLDIGFRETIFHSLRPLLPGSLMGYIMSFMSFLTDSYDSKENLHDYIAQPYGRRLPYPSFTLERNTISSFWDKYFINMLDNDQLEMKISQYFCSQWNATNIYDNRYAYHMKIVRKINQWQQLQFDSNYNFLPPSDPCKYTGGVVRSEFDCEKNEFIYTTGNWWKNRCYTL